jgi:DNA-directed RNA polymerase specialized sigma24 family protein
MERQVNVYGVRTCEDIGRILGISRQAVHARLKKALHKMQHRLARELNIKVDQQWKISIK